MDERSELDQLKQRQARLEKELHQLADELAQLESRLQNRPARPTPVPVAPKSSPPPAESRLAVPPPIPVPPIIPVVIPPKPAAAPAAELVSPPTATTTPPAASAEFLPAYLKQEQVSKQAEPDRGAELPPASPVRTPTPVNSPALAAAGPRASLEMRVGTYWLVRIGIVMLLTGLVFFGNYAYQNFIVRFGPLGKVILLYVASGVLLGAGARWQRRSVKESLRNYAQVLFAGGLAAVY
ncbi:MAG: DUF2339 domain-containing protein, partial [Verrucomicrobia bacterium]|nr:DUF2339 domain-containing protein [Verrucomicrobiota bacterium]